VKSISESTDEKLFLPGIRDVDDFFEQQKNFLTTYHAHLQEATSKADRMTARHKGNC
jgi:sorting nexin-5/6/32